MPKNFALHERRYLQTLIAETDTAGLSVNEGNEELRAANISAKGHAKQTFGSLSITDNNGFDLGDYAIFDNRIYTRDALIRKLGDS